MILTIKSAYFMLQMLVSHVHPAVFYATANTNTAKYSITQAQTVSKALEKF